VTEEGLAAPRGTHPTFSITDLTKPAGVVASIMRLFERQGRFLRDTRCSTWVTMPRRLREHNNGNEDGKVAEDIPALGDRQLIKERRGQRAAQCARGIKRARGTRIVRIVRESNDTLLAPDINSGLYFPRCLRNAVLSPSLTIQAVGWIGFLREDSQVSRSSSILAR